MRTHLAMAQEDHGLSGSQPYSPVLLASPEMTDVAHRLSDTRRQIVSN